jgi:hypothetical protein
MELWRFKMGPWRFKMELWRFKMELWRTVDAHNVEAWRLKREP